MIPVKCAVMHNPPEKYGDCLRACVASVLELPSKEVPHFYEGGRSPEDATAMLEKWLDDLQGLTFMILPIDAEILGFATLKAAATFPKNHYILMGSDHAVVCRGQEIVNNPSHTNQRPEPPYSVMIFVVK